MQLANKNYIEIDALGSGHNVTVSKGGEISIHEPDTTTEFENV